MDFQSSSRPVPAFYTEVFGMFKNMLDLFRPGEKLDASLPWSSSKLILHGVMVLFIIHLAMILSVVANVIGVALSHGSFSPSVFSKTDEIVATIGSYILGYGAGIGTLWILFKKNSLSIRKELGINLASLGGSWKRAVLLGVFALGVNLLLGQVLNLLPLPEPYSPAAQFAKGLSGLMFAAFFVLSVIIAPYCEEIVYRGFLFNAGRSAFRQGWLATIFRSEQSATIAAMVVSSAVFAAVHFTPSAFPELFAGGMVLAWIYRRSGTVITPIICHALNNLIVTAMLYSQSIAH